MAGLRRHIAGALVVLAVTAACGGGDNDTVDEGTAPVVTLISSGARWINTEDPRSEFDISVQKTDATILGVAVWWEYGIDDPEARLGSDLRAVVSIDGQPNFGTPAVTGLLRDGRLQEGAMAITETDGGFRVDYRLGRAHGASDLIDENGEPRVLADADIVIDFEAGSAELSTEFIEDLDTLGELAYSVALRGTLSTGTGANEEVELDDAVLFTTIESDPSAVQVDDDPDAVAQEEQAVTDTETEAAGCVVNRTVIDVTSFTITSPDETVTLRTDVPDGWTIEKPGADPCTDFGVEVSGPEQPGGSATNPEIGISVLDRLGETAQQIAEGWATSWNTRYDDSGNPFVLSESDDDYTSFDPVTEEMLLGRPTYRVVGNRDILDTVNLFVDAGAYVVELRYIFFRGDDSVAAPVFDTVISGTTLTVG